MLATPALEIGDDVAGVTSHGADLDPGDDPTGFRPGPGRVGKGLEPAYLLAILAADVAGLYPFHLSNVPCPLPRRIRQVHLPITSLSARPSPLFRRVGIRIITFEACSGFTHVTARWIAQPPLAAFVTRLRPRQLPSEIARQLPDLSTTIRVDPSSTGETRHRGAPNNSG